MLAKYKENVCIDWLTQNKKMSFGFQDILQANEFILAVRKIVRAMNSLLNPTRTACEGIPNFLIFDRQGDSNVYPQSLFCANILKISHFFV